MSTPHEIESAKRWTELPGLFRWTEVAAQIERANRIPGREVRASLVRRDKKGRALFQMSVAETEPTEPERRSA